MTPRKLNRSDASSPAVSKSIEPTFTIRSIGDCLTVMFWIRSRFVELSVFERIPRRMLRRLVVIVYWVKKRCDPAGQDRQCDPGEEDGADDRVGDVEPAHRIKQQQAEERRASA